uniref:Uncharacterized protein n=1 Tax=Fusarium oxysporum (strain Fo5176) TaxID=660025 RepID=A0A0D2Y2V7_FUSOF
MDDYVLVSHLPTDRTVQEELFLENATITVVVSAKLV